MKNSKYRLEFVAIQAGKTRTVAAVTSNAEYAGDAIGHALNLAHAHPQAKRADFFRVVQRFSDTTTKIISRQPITRAGYKYLHGKSGRDVEAEQYPNPSRSRKRRRNPGKGEKLPRDAKYFIVVQEKKGGPLIYWTYSPTLKGSAEKSRAVLLGSKFYRVGILNKKEFLQKFHLFKDGYRAK